MRTGQTIEGFRLVRIRRIRGRPYFDFTQVIKNVRVLTYWRTAGPRILKPVTMNLTISFDDVTELYHIDHIELIGSKTREWHPHIQYDEPNCICWGEATLNHYSLDLKKLLKETLFNVIGLLADFRHGGFHGPKNVYLVHTLPAIGELSKIKLLPNSLWRKNKGEFLE